MLEYLKEQDDDEDAECEVEGDQGIGVEMEPDLDREVVALVGPNAEDKPLVVEGLDLGVVEDQLVDAECMEAPAKGVRSGRHYLVSCVKRGKQKVFITSMKQGATQSTIQKALKQKGPRADKAMAAAIAEIQQIDEKQSWVPVKVSDLSKAELRKVIRAFMFITDKFKPNGDWDKAKAR